MEFCAILIIKRTAVVYAFLENLPVKNLAEAKRVHSTKFDEIQQTETCTMIFKYSHLTFIFPNYVERNMNIVAWLLVFRFLARVNRCG